MIFGSDFDNTIVDYNELFFSAACEAGLVTSDVPSNKTAVRDSVRLLPDGEVTWQKLQAEVYGPRINEAVLFSGLSEFLERCIVNKIPVYVVSHKTQYARRGNVDLRIAAIGFMAEKSLFNDGPYGLREDRVYFADTRSEKAQIISSLDCDVFVDDLVEVFEESLFPEKTVKYFFNPASGPTKPELESVCSWEDITAKVWPV